MQPTIRLSNACFQLDLDTERNGMTLLKRSGDAFDTNCLRTADPDLLGNLIIRYTEADGGALRSFCTRDGSAQYEQGENAAAWTCAQDAISLRESVSLDGEQMHWTIEVTNTSGAPIRIQDLELPMAFNQAYSKDTIVTYTQRVVRHSFCSLDGSFIYWCRPNGDGPMLAMVPAPGTALEYYRRDWKKAASAWEGPFSVFIHSEAAGRETEGKWKFPHTALTLQPGESRRYALNFAWARDHDDVRRLLYEMDSVDVIALPGMTVTPQMQVKLALRSREAIRQVIAPSGTAVVPLGEKCGYLLYDLSFAEAGEQPVEIRFGAGRRMFVEFFVTHPIGELLQNRAKHMVEHQDWDVVFHSHHVCGLSYLVLCHVVRPPAIVGQQIAQVIFKPCTNRPVHG